MASASIFISDDLSADVLTINIHSSSNQQLYSFALSRVSGRWTTQSPTITSAVSSVPIISTRSTVLDTLILDDSGSCHIRTSFGRTTPLSIPAPPSEGEDVAHKLANSLHMMVEEDERMHPAGSERQIVKLETGRFNQFYTCLRDGQRLCCSTDFSIPDELGQQTLEALSCALGADEFFAVKRELLLALQSFPQRKSQDGIWRAIERVIKSAIGLEGDNAVGNLHRSHIIGTASKSLDPIVTRLARKVNQRTSNRRSNGPISYTTTSINADLATRVVMVLHLLAQDCRLSLSQAQKVRRLARLIIDISTSLSWLDWRDYWLRVAPRENGAQLSMSSPSSVVIQPPYETPPDILVHLGRRLVRPLKPFPAITSIFTGPSEYGIPSICGQSSLVLQLFDVLGPGGNWDVSARARATVQFLVDKGLGLDWLADLPAWISLPVREMLRVCQLFPPAGCIKEVYDLIGREDLSCQVQMPRRLVSQLAELNTLPPIIGDVLIGKKAAKATRIDLPHVRFGSDRRLQEVERIMNTSSVRSISMSETKGSTDAEILQHHQAMVNTIAHRTLSITVGQGIFEYGSRSTVIIHIWDIPVIELSVKVYPAKTIFKAQVNADTADWACFHNGAAAALSIAPDCQGIDSAWIVLNKPANLNPEHGGFLLGLGLNGHLRNLMTYHAFPYMDSRHEFTSVGLLLGIACSYAGSEDMLVTKALSLHTHALLPTGSMELNAAPLVQSAALVGLGLVYVGTRNLRMAEVALGEVGRKYMPGTEGFTDYQEAYSFSAAVAFGLIMLGQGGQSAFDDVDRRMINRLRQCIYGGEPGKGTDQVDITITSPGATLALGLMYLKSNRSDIRDAIEIPSNPLALDWVRSDFLLIRTLARSLIMWKDVTASKTWVEAQLPTFIRDKVKDHPKVTGLELASEQAYLNIVGGACLAIGLKYAGTANEMAHNTLMLFFGVLSRACGGGGMSYEGQTRRTTARQALNIVTIALACVMSGTGELNILRRLRISHGQEGAGVNYGSHMAMHMALGLLFLGRGQYSLGTSDLGIAAMCIAFFPRFMPTADDNKSYPQAFRHLWALAAEPRCLMAQDVDSGETVYLPIRVKLRQGDQIRTQNLISPTLVAPFETLLSIEIDTPRYLPIKYDLTNPSHRSSFIRTRTIYVKRKAGFQDYNSDPKGNRSIFVRAGGLTGLDMHHDFISLAAPPPMPAKDVLDLISTHSPNSTHSLLLKSLIEDDSPVAKFVRTVILECVALDKPSMIGIYLELVTGMERMDAEMVRGLELIKWFYSAAWAKLYSPAAGLSGEKMLPLIRPAFLTAILRKADNEVESNVLEAYWRYAEWVGDHDGLARYLVRNGVPALRLLGALRDKLRLQPEEADIAEVKAREVARVYERTVGGQFDPSEGGGPGQVDILPYISDWKVNSVHSAVNAWLTRASAE